MPDNNYLKLLYDAGISDRGLQQRFSQFLDTVIVTEGITQADIVGVSPKSGDMLCVVHRDGVTLASERGLFNKRIETMRWGPISAIGRLRRDIEGFKGRDGLNIIAHDASGNIRWKISWGLGGPDYVMAQARQESERVFELISRAMDQVSEAPARPSVSMASSKAGALMDWAADVVKASGVEVSSARIQEHAMMAAGVIRLMKFLPLGGIDDLNKFYPNGEMPKGSVLETFDDLYEHVVARVGNARPVDQAIDKWLSDNWMEYVNGCREAYS